MTVFRPVIVVANRPPYTFDFYLKKVVPEIAAEDPDDPDGAKPK
ncbi:MAG TPA: hypothetical protein VMV69_06790 [Pirellulales bacterium]|nr:hypothetical protein [Pirellulales bacterium]